MGCLGEVSPGLTGDVVDVQIVDEACSRLHGCIFLCLWTPLDKQVRMYATNGLMQGTQTLLTKPMRLVRFDSLDFTAN